MNHSLLASVVPVAKVPAVEKALQATFNNASIETIELLTDGLSSALVYKIGVSGHFFVLRLVMRVEAINDPHRQYHCMKLAAEAGIAPRVLYTDADEAISITEFIPTLPTTEGFRPLDELLPMLVATIKAIHALLLFPQLVDYMDGVDMFIQRFHESQILPESATAEHFQLYSQIQRLYPRHETDLVSSHNDLNPNNILFDGQRLWVIDWEVAFANDRYVDLAIAVNFLPLDLEHEEAYLRAYFGEALDDYKRARFFLMRQIALMFFSMAFLSMVAASLAPGETIDTNMEALSHEELRAGRRSGQISLASSEGQLIYAKALLSQMLTNMKTPRFEAALNTIANPL